MVTVMSPFRNALSGLTDRILAPVCVAAVAALLLLPTTAVHADTHDKGRDRDVGIDRDPNPGRDRDVGVDRDPDPGRDRDIGRDRDPGRDRGPGPG